MEKNEIMKVLKEEKIDYLQMQFIDIFGICKHVEVPKTQFEKAVSGDVMFDGSQGYAIASTEELISYLSIHFLETGRFNLRRILLFGNYDGVYDSNKKVIKEINKENFDEVATCLSDSDEIDATGGMKQKVESMFELAKKGVTVEILNGAVKGNIKNSLLGKSGLGTRISYP